jgi:hypothetical protein
VKNREFDYFLFDNFDTATVHIFDNPRNYLNKSADKILSDVVNAGVFGCSYNEMCDQYTSQQINNLIHIGLFRVERDILLLDSTVVVHEDIHNIESYLKAEISHLADELCEKKSELYACVRSVENGLDEKTNLYHLLCGAVFDGSVFDYLSNHQALATSRLHPAGIDYIITIYEKCPELDRFSNHLLCSYNRFSDGSRTLQSFGDANGNRIDFYRFYCQKMMGAVSPKFKHIEKMWDAVAPYNDRVHILNALQAFDQNGICDEKYMRLFEAFGYIVDGKYAVPVFRKNASSIVEELTKIVVACIGMDMEKILSDSPIMSQLSCCQHGVSKKEAANEMYHILFGMLNEELVTRGIVQNPNHIDGEGRYLKSIELYTN